MTQLQTAFCIECLRADMSDQRAPASYLGHVHLQGELVEAGHCVDHATNALDLESCGVADDPCGGDWVRAMGVNVPVKPGVVTKLVRTIGGGVRWIFALD